MLVDYLYNKVTECYLQKKLLKDAAGPDVSSSEQTTIILNQQWISGIIDQANQTH